MNLLQTSNQSAVFRNIVRGDTNRGIELVEDFSILSYHRTVSSRAWITARTAIGSDLKCVRH